MADERGVGNVFNVPRGPGAPPARYVDDLWAAIVAATTGWTPDLVLVSAGFDAMLGDPLGGFTLEPEHYADLTRRLRERLPDGADRRAARGRLRARAAGRRGAGARAARSPSLQPARPRPAPVTPRTPWPSSSTWKPSILELRTKHPFIIARGGQSDYRTIWVRLRDADGNEGWGEATPSRFYGETAETVLAALNVYVGGHAVPIRSTSRRPSAAGSRCSAVNAVGPRGARPARCTIWSASGSACRSIGCGASIRPRRRGPPSPSGSTRPSGSGSRCEEAAEYPDPQDQARHRPGRRDPAHDPRARPTRRSGSTPTAAGR